MEERTVRKGRSKAGGEGEVEEGGGVVSVEEEEEEEEVVGVEFCKGSDESSSGMPTPSPGESLTLCISSSSAVF